MHKMNFLKIFVWYLIYTPPIPNSNETFCGIEIFICFLTLHFFMKHMPVAEPPCCSKSRKKLLRGRFYAEWIVHIKIKQRTYCLARRNCRVASRCEIVNTEDIERRQHASGKNMHNFYEDKIHSKNLMLISF